MEGQSRSGLSQAGGELRGREDPGQVPLLATMVGTQEKAKHGEDFLGAFEHC